MRRVQASLGEGVGPSRAMVSCRHRGGISEAQQSELRAMGGLSSGQKMLQKEKKVKDGAGGSAVIAEIRSHVQLSGYDAT